MLSADENTLYLIHYIDAFRFVNCHIKQIVLLSTDLNKQCDQLCAIRRCNYHVMELFNTVNYLIHFR